MSEKLSKAQLEFLKKTSAAGAGGGIVSALLSHIEAMEKEAQQGERQAFVAGAYWMNDEGHEDEMFGEEYLRAAILKQAATRYPAARPMPTRGPTEADALEVASRVWGVGQFDSGDMLLAFYRGLSEKSKSLAAVTQNEIEHEIFWAMGDELSGDGVAVSKAADAIMRLIGGKNEHNSI